MKNTILTNKGGELYVWQRPKQPIYPSANQDLTSNGRCWDRYEKELGIYKEARERAKAEAVKVVNVKERAGDKMDDAVGYKHSGGIFMYGVFKPIKPGEDLPLPEGLGVEIVDRPCYETPGTYPCPMECNGCHCIRPIKVARIITKPVDK
jgi:hypothetical protein